jgi:sugar transferase (PEP-CTERM/EpsH1 system associated)
MKILFLNKRLLFPANSGGRIRTMNVVRYLARQHDVTYLCNLQPHDADHVSAMQALGVRLVTVPWRETPRGSARFYGELTANLFSPYPFNVDKDYDPQLRHRAAQLLAEDEYDLVICDFVQMARNVLGLACPVSVLFEHNVEAQIFARHAQTDRSAARRWYMALQASKMKRFEAQAGRGFDLVIAVSDTDRRVFEQEYGWQNVHTIDTGVDVEYFRPFPGVEQAERVVFIGSLDWLPNEEGLEFFVRDIWPEIRRQRPDALFQIVGRSPSAAIGRLAAAPGVELVGAVPDVRPYVAAASLVVVPLRIGGGTRIKIFEAMAMGKAVVSTTLGAEGLAVTSGDNVMLADAPADFAASVVSLLADQSRRASIGARARSLVEQNFSSETVGRQFEQICLTAAATTSRAPGRGSRPS